MWLVPSLVVLIAAMTWVTWLGRDGRGEVDRDVAVARLGKALAKEHPTRVAPLRDQRRDRSSGIAVRPTQARDHTRRVS